MKLIALLFFSGLAYSQPRVAVKLLPLETITAKPGQTVSVTLTALIDEGFHVNSDKPADQYLIPLRLTWTSSALENPAVTYPKPETAKLAFSAKPVSIYSGEFAIVTRFKVASKAQPGQSVVAGKLRFQACNDRECLIPRTLDVTVPIEIVK